MTVAWKRAAINRVTFHNITGRDWLALALILLAAAVTRLSNLETFGYHQDQADLVTLAQNLIEGKSFPLLGIPSSARIPNSPVTVYAIVPPLLVSDNLAVIVLYVVLLNLIGVGLLWLIAHRYFNPTIALIAGLAYAVNPWAVGYSRDIWAQSYHTPIFLLSLWLGLYGFLEGKRWAQVLCLPVMFAALQIHIAAWALFPVYLWLVWIGRRQISRPALAISVALTLLTLLPFALGIAQFFSENSSSSAVQTQSRPFTPRELIKPYGQVIWLMTGLGTEQYSAREDAEALLAAAAMPTILWPILGAATLLGIPLIWLRWPRPLAVLVLLWAFLPLAVLTAPVLAVFPHYFVPDIPAFVILAAVSIEAVLGWLPGRAARLAAVGVVGIIFASQAIFSLRAQSFANAHYSPGQFGTSTPITYLYGVRDAVADYRDVVVVSSSDWTEVSANGRAVWSSLLRKTAECVREITLPPAFAVFPAGPFASIVAPRVPDDGVVTTLYRAASPSVIPLRPDEGVYTVSYFEQAPTLDALTLNTVAPSRFDNGVALTGYQLADAQLVLEWTLPQATPRNYDYTITFVDKDGQSLGQEASAFWPGLNWCAGDRLLSWRAVDLLPGTTALHVGMALASSGQAVSVASGEAVEIPLNP